MSTSSTRPPLASFDEPSTGFCVGKALARRAPDAREGVCAAGFVSASRNFLLCVALCTFFGTAGADQVILWGQLKDSL